MKINFYDTRLDDKRTILIKDKTIDYDLNIKTDNPSGIVELMKSVLDMDKLAEEHCYMLVMNNACDLLGVFFLSKGTVNSSILNVREIFIRVFLIGGSMIVLCHNHPSGRAEPTKTDLETTDKIKMTGEMMGIPLIDHIILGGSSYYSFSENNLLT